jgi:tRNA A64-2'-O-ribosylphosphate transferase
MPDALSKTVPIWCAVVNRAVKMRYQKDDVWDTSLYTSPAVVSRQEHLQVESQLSTWSASLFVRIGFGPLVQIIIEHDSIQASCYDLPNLEYPLRPLWITPATSSYPRLPAHSDRTFYPIICISASRQIEEGLERRSKGFAYVQGSGDDHELWGEVGVPTSNCRWPTITTRFRA